MKFRLASLTQIRTHWKRILGLGILLLISLPLLWGTAKLAKSSNSRIWFPSYAKDFVSGRYSHEDDTRHMIFLMCDHWEPGGGPEGWAIADDWLSRFESIAAEHADSQGRNFQYSWFYPIDNFEPRILARISDTVQKGFGEIEVHWHHRHQDSAVFEKDLQAALVKFTEVGALISKPGDRPRFSFIHGNWALDNSRTKRHCGIDDEIAILRKAGCYADFTFPALGTSAQPSTINRIFYVEDTPERKSYEVDPVPARVGVEGTGLLMIPGPLGLDFRNPLVLIEYACLDDAEGSGFSGKIRKPSNYRDYFKPHRVQLWDEIGVGVEGNREWVFVKIHAHGVQHRDYLLGGELDAMLGSVEEYCRQRGITLHYVSAREAFNLVKALEANAGDRPEKLYDFVIPPPLNRASPVHSTQ